MHCPPIKVAESEQVTVNPKLVRRFLYRSVHLFTLEFTGISHARVAWAFRSVPAS